MLQIYASQFKYYTAGYRITFLIKKTNLENLKKRRYLPDAGISVQKINSCVAFVIEHLRTESQYIHEKLGISQDTNES